LIELTRESGLSEAETDSIVDNLSYVKDESISKTGRDFVDSVLGNKEYGGEIAKKYFQRCYTARSQLVHSGRVSDDTPDVRSLVSELDRMVADLLVASVGRSDT
jgi:hypothetical protein